MKVKKIAKRLRKLSAEFHSRALNYDGETKEAECARLFTIADVCQLLADDVLSGSAKKRKKAKNRTPIAAVNGKDGAMMGWEKGKNFPPRKAAD